MEDPYCYRCGKPLKHAEQEYCLDCSGRTSYFEMGRALFVHEGKAADAIYRYKFKNKRVYAETFAKELAAEYGEQLKKWEIQAIVPVPLHKKRRRQRGFNQTELLGRFLSAETGIPMETKALFRIRETSRQKTLGHRGRMWNLHNAFAVSRDWIPVKNVLLLDDIFTTGSTINKAAKMLKIAGVQKVYFLTISIGQGL